MSIITLQLTESMTQKDLEKMLSPEIVKVVTFLETELKKIRTGRASTALVEDIKISVYGGSQFLSLKALGLISSSDASTIVIQPFDPSVVGDIERGLLQADLGVQPRNDGKSIRLTFPPMSQERRVELTKVVSKKCEEALVSLRKVRHEVLELIKNAEKKTKSISEDGSKRLQKFLQNIVDEQTKNLNTISDKKVQQITDL